MPITIEWPSSFRKDGSRRRPPPSTMHGWLAKMRGTLLGDEELRSKGMQEMRDARAARQRNRARKRQAQGGCTLFSLFVARKQTSRPSMRRRTTQGQRPRGRHHHPTQPPLSRPHPSRKASGASGRSRRATSKDTTRRDSSRQHIHPARRGSGR